jgi:hypothetical protein
MGWRRPNTKQDNVINSIGWKGGKKRDSWYNNKIKRDVKSMVEFYKDEKDYLLLKCLYDLIDEKEDFIDPNVLMVVLKILMKQYEKIGDFDPRKHSSWDNYCEKEFVENGVTLYRRYLVERLNELPTDKDIEKQTEVVYGMTNDELKKLLRKYDNSWDTYWEQVGRDKYKSEVK